jgi:hypothetical protein
MCLGRLQGTGGVYATDVTLLNEQKSSVGGMESSSIPDIKGMEAV